MRNVRLALWALVAVAACGLAAAALWQQLKPAQNPQRITSTGESLIKAEFSLQDHEGKAVSEETYRDRWMLIFFGYTYCPDVCPTTLGTISSVMDDLAAQSTHLQPLFITVDPERDTQEAMAAYVEAFHPGIVGLTGSKQDIAEVAGNFRVYYGRVENEEDPEAYLMDHSGILYLVDPEGKFVKHFSSNARPEEIVEELRKVL